MLIVPIFFVPDDILKIQRNSINSVYINIYFLVSFLVQTKLRSRPLMDCNVH